MIRNLKGLGLALMTVAAMMSAVAASSASAAQFTSAAQDTTITANQATSHTLKVTDQEVTCSSVSFHGLASAKAVTSVTIEPSYTNCKGFLGITATVTGFKHVPSGSGFCDYNLRADGQVDLECTGGTTGISIGAAACAIHIPQQTNIGTINYTNGINGGTGKADITATFNITNINGTHTDGFLCPFSGGGSVSNISLTGVSTIVGSANGVAVDISRDS